MSLYVGHLKPHVSGEELERVFRRFGRCSLQLKDGYAFVVYEVTADAQKALRTLRGKIICGEHLFLDWSNKQPKAYQNSARSYKVYEPYHRRNSRGDDNGFRRRNFQVRRDFVGGSRVPGSRHGGDHPDDAFVGGSRVPGSRHGGDHPDDAFDKETGLNSEDASDFGKGKSSDVKEKVTGEVGLSDPSPVENDRWGEPASDALNGRGQEDSSDFNRYEPDRGYNGKDEKEHYQMASPYSSREQGSSHEKRQREHTFDGIDKATDTSKPYQTCFNCGLVGHIKRNCPRGDTRRDTFGKFNTRKDEMKFEGQNQERMKRSRPNSWRRPNSDTFLTRNRTRDKKDPHFERGRRADRNETIKKIRSNSRPEYEGKERRPENGNPKRKLKKRARKPDTSSSSDYSTTNSKSRSKALKSSSASSSHSRSRSRSSSSRSTSSSSRSRSGSPRQNSPSSRSWSKSRPRSRSISKPRSSSTSKRRSRSSSTSSLLRSHSLSVSLDKNSHPSTHIDPTNVCTSTSPKDQLGHAPSSESKGLLADGNSNPLGTCSTIKDPKVSTRVKVDGEPKGEHSKSDQDDTLFSTYEVREMENNAFINTHIGSDVKIERQGGIDLISENQGEKPEMQEDTDPMVNTQVLPRAEGSYSTSISTQEMLLALKHYGLATPHEGESVISVESYFGAARMWPWEMVYYRRLKKGPISTANYARRLEQNREYGIVDKYIRSSSGWGECHQSDA